MGVSFIEIVSSTVLLVIVVIAIVGQISSAERRMGSSSWTADFDTVHGIGLDQTSNTSSSGAFDRDPVGIEHGFAIEQ